MGLYKDFELAGKSATVFFVNGIGDAILCLPTVRALAELFEGRLSIAFTPQKAAFFFDHIPAKKIPINAWYRNNAIPGADTPSFDATVVARDIGFTDFFISLINWTSCDTVQLLNRLAPSVSMGRGQPFQHQLEWSLRRHTADSMFDAVKHIAPHWRLEDFWGLPEMPASIRRQGKAMLSGFPHRGKTLAVHVDGTQHERSSMGDRIGEMLKYFLDGHPDIVAFLIGSECRVDADLLDHGRIVSCLGLPLATSIYLLRNADLFVGVNSCFLHAADMLRTPGVGLFGPGSASQWGFRVGPGICIEARETIAAIHPQDVVHALEQLLLERL